MDYWVVWNDAKNEGVIFADKSDAEYASTGRQTAISVSTLADHFCKEIYDDDARSEPQKISL